MLIIKQLFFLILPQVLVAEQDIILWGAQNQVNLFTSKLCPPFAPSKSGKYPCFSREMTIHFYVGKSSIFIQGPSLFHTGYFRLCHLFVQTLKHDFSRRKRVPCLQTNSSLCCRSSLLTVRVCRWLANSIETGWEKKDYKPALCVLGSSTVYFYCTWSINLSIDLCCHYFFDMHMRCE